MSYYKLLFIYCFIGFRCFLCFVFYIVKLIFPITVQFEYHHICFWEIYSGDLSSLSKALGWIVDDCLIYVIFIMLITLVMSKTFWRSDFTNSKATKEKGKKLAENQGCIYTPGKTFSTPKHFQDCFLKIRLNVHDVE